MRLDGHEFFNDGLDSWGAGQDGGDEGDGSEAVWLIGGCFEVFFQFLEFLGGG